jgi:hypothetical protein
MTPGINNPLIYHETRLMEKAPSLSEEGLALAFGQADRAIASSADGLRGTGDRLPACVVGEPGDPFLAPNMNPLTVNVWS